MRSASKCSLAREGGAIQEAGNAAVWREERSVMAGQKGKHLCKVLEAGIAHALQDTPSFQSPGGSLTLTE